MEFLEHGWNIVSSKGGGAGDGGLWFIQSLISKIDGALLH